MLLLVTWISVRVMRAYGSESTLKTSILRQTYFSPHNLPKAFTASTAHASISLIQFRATPKACEARVRGLPVSIPYVALFVLSTSKFSGRLSWLQVKKMVLP